MTEIKDKKYRHYCQETGEYMYSDDINGHCPKCGSSDWELVEKESAESKDFPTGVTSKDCGHSLFAGPDCMKNCDVWQQCLESTRMYLGV